MTDALRDLLINHEGLRLKPYKDTVGKLTIGIGRNLDDRGISKAEAYLMMDNDIAAIKIELSRFAWFNALDNVRKDAIIDMAFNLGVPKFLEFKNMISALAVKNYNQAAKEMTQSKWALQVNKRAFDLSQIILTGEYPHEP